MDRKNASRSHVRTRVSKQDWLKAALDLLVTGGIEAVRVERLAANLDVAKSGFYYHFAERGDLHEALLDYWLTLDSEPIQLITGMKEATPVDRLRAVGDIVDRLNLSKVDAAIRQWAKQDAKVRRVWTAQSKKRLGFLRDQFGLLGFTGDENEMRARAFLLLGANERNFFPDLKGKDRARLRELRLQVLIKTQDDGAA
ncbi:MAG: TetR/AcrR family transcriptional regulator [Pseudomonadota bacterium]